MASSAEVLQKAIQAARAGRRVEARDLLIELVEGDPRNEMAWMWLSGLVDSLEDRIIACENVLTINPANEKVRVHLAELQRQYGTFLPGKNTENATALFNQATLYAKQRDTDTALQFAMQAVQACEDHEEAWLLIGRVSPDIHQQIAALERASKLNPSNTETALALKQARYVRAHPLSAAECLEEEGKFEEALKLYAIQAAKARDLREFDRIQARISHIERLRKENIRHVTPASSITRLTFTWPLLYLSLVLFQVGINPLKHPNIYLWLGLPLVLIGSFLLALAEVRSHHILWRKLFHEQGAGSPFARSAAAVTGWFLVLMPHILLIIDSLNRLHNLTIPPLPF